MKYAERTEKNQKITLRLESLVSETCRVVRVFRVLNLFQFFGMFPPRAGQRREGDIEFSVFLEEKSLAALRAGAK